MKTKRTNSPQASESTAVRIGGRALQVASEQAHSNGMTLRPTVETIILAWRHIEDGHSQGIGAAVIARTTAGAHPIDATVAEIKGRMRKTPAASNGAKARKGGAQ